MEIKIKVKSEKEKEYIEKSFNRSVVCLELAEAFTENTRSLSGIIGTLESGDLEKRAKNALTWMEQNYNKTYSALASIAEMLRDCCDETENIVISCEK